MKIDYNAWSEERLLRQKKNLKHDIKDGNLSSREKSACRTEIARIDKALNKLKRNK